MSSTRFLGRTIDTWVTIATLAIGVLTGMALMWAFGEATSGPQNQKCESSAAVAPMFPEAGDSPAMPSPFNGAAIAV